MGARSIIWGASLLASPLLLLLLLLFLLLLLLLLHLIQQTSWSKICLLFFRTMFVIFMFGFGALITNLFTNLGKVTVGRLRPYFLTVCKPNVTLANCSQGFITGDVCTGNPKDVLEARSVAWLGLALQS